MLNVATIAVMSNNPKPMVNFVSFVYRLKTAFKCVVTLNTIVYDLTKQNAEIINPSQSSMTDDASSCYVLFPFDLWSSRGLI